MLQADSTKVSARAKKRGLPQLGKRSQTPCNICYCSIYNICYCNIYNSTTAQSTTKPWNICSNYNSATRYTILPLHLQLPIVCLQILKVDSNVPPGTLGAGNHYTEIQVVEEIYNKQAARRMGIDEIGQVHIRNHIGNHTQSHSQSHTQSHVRLRTSRQALY